MTWNGWLQIAVFVAIVLVLVKPLGLYMTKVFDGERTWLSPVLRPVERLFYAASGVRENEDQHWLAYAFGMLLFNAAGFFLLYAILRLQAYLPWNPQGFGNCAGGPRLQHRHQLHHQHQLAELCRRSHHELFQPDGRAHRAQLRQRGHRHRARRGADPRLRAQDASASGIGNFWVDLTRCCLYVLLPISIVFALFLVWQGMPQNLDPYVDRDHAGRRAADHRAEGPVASQVAIKMLGTNGGGFFNANAAHPYENPTALSNLIQMVAIFALGAALTNVFGRMIGDQRQGWALLAAMGVMFLIGVCRRLLGGGAGQPGLRHR